MITLEHIETDITSACNNVCVCCDHYSPLLPKRFVKPEDYRRELAAAAKLIHAKEYSLLGGEPTLHPQLLDILTIARESGICDRLQVITNGQTIRNQAPEFWERIDSLWITRYTGKIPSADIDWAKGMCMERGLEFVLKDRGILSRTFTAHEVSEGEAQGRFSRCHLKHCNILDGGYLYLCCAAPFVAPLLIGLPEGTDGIDLSTATEADVQAYLARPGAFQGCKRCVEVDGIIFPWRESTRANWRADSEMP